MLKRLLAGKKVRNVGLAELKLTLTLIFKMAISAVGLVSYSLIDIELFNEFTAYILCESRRGPDCVLDSVNIFNVGLPITFIMLSIVPMLSIMLSCDFKTCKMKIKGLYMQINVNKK